MSARKREDDAEKQQHAQLRESSSQRPLGVQTSTLLPRYERDKASFPSPAERWWTGQSAAARLACAWDGNVNAFSPRCPVAAPPTREESEVKGNRSSIGMAVLLVILGAAVLVGSVSRGSTTASRVVREADAEGVHAASADPDRAGGERVARMTRATTSTAFGPNVVDGRFDGVSAAVSSLPVRVALPVTSITARDNEELQRGSGTNTAKVPVVHILEDSPLDSSGPLVIIGEP